MNKKQKSSIILASLASIAVAGSLIAGSTYALFTSESKTNIAVTSGTVNVEAVASDLWVYSPTSISTDVGNPIIDTTNVASVITEGVSGRFYNGGVATLNASEGVVTLDKMTPGDKATFKITITNKSNVKTKYRTVIKKIDPTDDVLFEALDFNIGGLTPEVATVWQNLKAPETEGGEVVTTYNCKVELPTTISGSEYMDKKCTIQILVEAIQGNAYTSDDNGTTIASDDIDSSTNSLIMNGDTEEESTIIAEVPADSTDATKLTLVKEPTDVPGSITINAGGSAISTDVKLIDQDGNTVVAKNEKFFTITIDLGKNLDVVSFYHNSVKLTQAASLSSLTSVNLFYYDSSSGKVTFTTTDFSVFTLEVKFAGGLGTEEAPYLIENAENFKALNDEYSSGEFNYYKIADGVTEIDLSNVERANIHGVFDGNGATLISNKCIFNTAGYYDKENNTFASEETILKNFNVNLTNSAQALVFQVGASTLTYDNIKVSGHIERYYHSAAFLNYGTGNLDYDSINNPTNYGADFTLNFKNCSIDAEILDTASDAVASLVGYPFQGNHTAVINVDSATNTALDSVKQYAKGTTAGHRYYGMGSATVYVDGELTNDNSFTAKAIAVNNPSKNSNNQYAITPVSGATKIKFQLGTQLSAYTDELVKISGLSGITNSAGNFYEYDVSGSDDVVFDAIPSEIKSILIVNKLTDSNKPEWQFDDSTGALTIITNSTDNYIDGSVTVYAKQYDEEGNILTTGSLEIASKSGISSTDSWVIN